MKYLIIGAGGTGGSIAASMAAADMDVMAIARGEHLAAIQKYGIETENASGAEHRAVPLRASDMEHYSGEPDVIFVCVKGYSLDETIPFISKIAGRDTIVIPLLNIYGTGGRMQEQLPDMLVTDGCIYIAAEIRKPGVILRKGDIFRVIFGVRRQEEYRSSLEKIAEDLDKSHIEATVSENIKRDALQKFSYVSPMAACGAYYDADAGAVQQTGKERDMFISLMGEIESLAEAMGIHFNVDIVRTNLEILDSLEPAASTSMQRDIKKGGRSETDGLVFEVVRTGRKLGVPVPVYEKAAAELGFEKQKEKF